MMNRTNFRSKLCSWLSDLIVTLVAAGVLCLAQPLYAQSDRGEVTLQLSLVRAYMYVAARTTWPEEVLKDKETFVFCINRGHELFDTFSSYLPTRKLHERRIELRFFSESDATGQRACNIIALAKNSSENSTVAKNLRGHPVLTISHEADITEDGGLVYLSHGKTLEPPKIDFPALKESGLKIDSGILDISQRRWGGKW